MILIIIGLLSVVMQGNLENPMPLSRFKRRLFTGIGRAGSRLRSVDYAQPLPWKGGKNLDKLPSKATWKHKFVPNAKTIKNVGKVKYQFKHPYLQHMFISGSTGNRNCC